MKHIVSFKGFTQLFHYHFGAIRSHSVVAVVTPTTQDCATWLATRSAATCLTLLISRGAHIHLVFGHHFAALVQNQRRYYLEDRTRLKTLRFKSQLFIDRT